MIPDIAQGHVIPAYTDKLLADNVAGDTLKQLRRLPAEWRQNAMAETHSRCYEAPSLSSREGVPVKGKYFHEELERVTNEILQQIGKM